MKIKVISLKGISNYFLKILVLTVIAVIFGRFFYSNRNVNASLKVNSSSFLKIMNKEISLFENTEKLDDFRKFSDYSKKTLNDEFTLIKMANSQNVESFSINVNSTANVENNEQEANSNNTTDAEPNIEGVTNTVNSENSIVEPEVRTKYRSACIKCAR